MTRTRTIGIGHGNLRASRLEVCFLGNDMVTSRKYIGGSFESSVRAFLAGLDPPTSMRYTLVTCMDSCTDVQQVVSRNSGLRQLSSQAVGQGVLFETAELISVDRKQQVFFGFDEVWFLRDRTLTEKPQSFSLAGRTEALSSLLPEEICQWMENCGCSLGLGDGIRLNFVARLRGLGRRLVVHWLDAMEFSRTQ